MKKSVLLASLLFLSAIVFAQVHPAKIFSDSMVLQRSIKIPVWGWASPDEKVEVRLNKQVKTIQAGSNGKWRVDLDAEKEGGPYELTIRATSGVTVLHDVLVGDVWICSGQSNMEFAVHSSNNSSEEIDAADFPMIRHIKIATAVGTKPWDDIGRNTGWKAASPANVGNFTAVGYFFARELYQQLHVPIGLINTNWGGTDVETWTSREAFENSDEFKEMIAQVPSLNLDSLGMVQERKMTDVIVKLQGSLPSPQAIALFNKNSFDDSKWPRIKVPGLWESQSLPDFDGVVWFRREIIVSATDAGKSASLSLGPIDDNDVTYVNGVKVGSTNAYNVPRNYMIPPGVLKEGTNIISIRVEDTGGGGGLYGAADDLQLTVNGHKQSVAGEWLFMVESVINGNGSVGPNSYPALLYNAMIAPLIPFGIKGAIWYQGENNAGRAYQYRKAFPLMITDWRKHWAQGDFPFYFVQLASFSASNGNSEKGSGWAELREAQTLTLSLPNTGMAVTTDIGETKDIHPKNKQDVGKRLAAVALHNTYEKTNMIYSGPVFKSMNMDDGKLVLSFSCIGGGLVINRPDRSSRTDLPAVNGGMYRDMTPSLQGFEIAGEDRKFYPALALIKMDIIVLSSPHVAAPVAARYAWADDAGNANLYNKEGFPGVPFRTDQWKGITETVKYRGK